MQKQAKHSFFIYCDDPKSFFFANNSCNPQPIQTKFYTVMGAQMGHFPGNFGHPQCQNDPEKNELFSHGNNVYSLLFLSQYTVVC